MSINNKDVVIIYTDGACKGNPGKGGWGALLLYNGIIKEIYGGEDFTTNNRMELFAVINALNLLKKKSKVNIYTDSKYVQNGITIWINKWKQNGWKTANKQAVKNQDLWMELDKKISNHSITWFWVKGHNNDIYNNRADELANLGISN